MASIAAAGTPAFSAKGACAYHSYWARQNWAVVIIASSERRSGSEVPHRRCSPSFAACSQISGARISSWNGPPNRPRRPATIRSCTRRCAGVISAGVISAYRVIFSPLLLRFPHVAEPTTLYSIYLDGERQGSAILYSFASMTRRKAKGLLSTIGYVEVTSN